MKGTEIYLPYEKTEADAVLLPVPFTRDGVHIFAPESSEKILISEVLASVPEQTMIFAGGVNGIADQRISDYA